MAFRFNFNVEQETEQLCRDSNSLSNDNCSSESIRGNEKPLLCANVVPSYTDSVESSSIPPFCKRHVVYLHSKVMNTSENIVSLKLLECGRSDSVTSTLWYKNGNFVDLLSSDGAASSHNDTLADLIEHSDVRSGVYEGGFKIWECSIDLVHFLKSSNIDTRGKCVLELGCGGGLPGIYCLLNGANSVCFQDFNEEVIDYFTIPNLYVNIENSSEVRLGSSETLDYIDNKAVFLSGDWKGVERHLEKENMQYDLILSSETIYNPSYYPAFHGLICSCLKRTGYALLANKSYYFGVGGSSKEFVQYVEMVGKLQCRIVQEITQGVNRDILKLEWK